MSLAKLAILVEDCQVVFFMITTAACVSSYVNPIYLSVILYLADVSPCGTARLKIPYMWSCCALS